MEIPVRVMSLQRSAERRQAFARDNAHLPYRFFDARDGAALTPAELQDPRHFIQPLRLHSLGAYGNALSHLALWDEAIAQDRALTIAEDDAVFRHDFDSASQALIARLPDDWDLVLWGWNFDSILSVRSLGPVSPVVMLFSQDMLRENIPAFQQATTPADPLPLDRCFGTPAYTISPRGARRFRGECFPMRPFELFFPVLNRKLPNTALDISMARIYSRTKSFAAFPPLAATRNEHGKSTVQR